MDRPLPLHATAGHNAPMNLNRKILNLRLDRRIRQQKLARAIGITPSALSKLESATNEPVGKNLLHLARHLSVPAEYPIDAGQPYPYQPPGFTAPPDGDKLVTAEVTREEKHLLEHLRKRDMARKVVHALPGLSIEALSIVHRLVMSGRGKEIGRQVVKLVKDG